MYHVTDNNNFTKNKMKRVPDSTLRRWNYEACGKEPVFGTHDESEVDVWRQRWIWLFQEMNAQVHELQSKIEELQNDENS